MSQTHNMIQVAQDELSALVLGALGRLCANGAVPAEGIPAFSVEIPNDRAHGDFATNVAMVCAKGFKLPPRKIAELICDEMVLDGSCFEKAEIAGPGFLNFHLHRRWFAEVVGAVLKQGESYGRTDYGKGKRVLVEFVSANPTGPMHIGNARGGAIGDCLASVLDAAGYEVSREFYINDAGNQIEKFATSLEVRYLQLYKGEEAVLLPEDAYQGEDIKQHAKAFSDLHGDKYVNASDAARRKALVEYALPINIKRLEDDLRTYRIEYDNWFRESTLHNNGEVDRVIGLLKEGGYTYESDGALWFRATDFGSDKDYVLVRSNGLATYVVPDIAYHYNKLCVRGYDKAINILGADHHGYAPRLKAAISALGIDQSRLDIVIMQMVRLMRDGELVKVSKRTGKSITLATLLDEVPIDAARFYFNLREANTHFDFDLGLAVEETSQNPVYYVQYAHARICSILSNLQHEGVVPCELSIPALAVLTKPEELELIRHLAILPSEMNEAAKSYDPSRITRYSIELATLFHKFYSVCRVKGEVVEVMQARLSLCQAVKITLNNVLTLLKISCPDSM